MNTPRELFQSNKNLNDWWMSVVKDERFDVVRIHAMASAMETNPSQETRNGMILMLSLMQQLCEKEQPEMPMPSSGLTHNIDRTRKPNEKSQK